MMTKQRKRTFMKFALVGGFMAIVIAPITAWIIMDALEISNPVYVGWGVVGSGTLLKFLLYEKIGMFSEYSQSPANRPKVFRAIW